MARLPVSGAMMATPFRDKMELQRVISDLQVGHLFDEGAIDGFYWELGKIIGQWLAEQQRLEVSALAKLLLSMASGLGEVSQVLQALVPGFNPRFEFEVASRTADYLALDPTVGSREKAEKLLSAFQQDAARIAHVCLMAHADLPHRTEERGRQPLDWYDDFTALLLDIAAKSAIKPTLRKDRISGARSGWLFDAAQALET